MPMRPDFIVFRGLLYLSNYSTSKHLLLLIVFLHLDLIIFYFGIVVSASRYFIV